MASDPLITDLERLVADLPARERGKFNQIYQVSTSTAEIRLQPELEPWIKAQFGSIEAITRQKIVRLANKVSHEECFINEQRASRPSELKNPANLEDELARAAPNDIFRVPESSTAEDIIGRIKGKYCITAGNVTKTDSFHGVVIFDDFNPLEFTREKIADYIETASEWAKQINALRPEANYFLFFWNCLWRAGASLTHGHAQIMLGRDRHYAKVENLRQSALEYHQRYGSNYFEDLFSVHQALGCGFEKDGIRILSYLTPLKFSQVMLFGEAVTPAFKNQIFDLLALFRDSLKVTNFNFGLVRPPLIPTGENWQDFPCIAQIIDRGSYDSRFSDFGSFELFGATMVVSDQFRLARLIRAMTA